MTSKSWYRRYFGQRYYNAIKDILTQQRTQKEVGFIELVLDLPPGAPILDLACGYGRHAIELAKRGYQVTGLDLDEYLLGKARELAEEAGVNIELIHADMRDIPEGRTFSGVINMFTAFGYLEDEEQDLKVLKGVHRCLARGGKFLINTINREWLIRNFQPDSWRKASDGTLILEKREFDLHTGRTSVEEIVIRPGGQPETFNHSIRLYSLTEMKTMLERAGLKISHVYGDFDGNNYTLDSRWMTILAEKT